MRRSSTVQRAGAFGLVLFAGIAAGAKEKNEPDFLAKALETAGGTPKFDRIETLQGRFFLVRPSTSGIVNIAVDFAARRTPEGWRVAEKIPGAAARVWTASAPFDLGDPAGDPDFRSARERFFLLLAPYQLEQFRLPARYLGMGFLQNRLQRRLALGPAAGAAEPWTIYVDTAPAFLRGMDARAAPGTWLFEGEEMFQNQFFLPTRWTRYSAEGKRLEVVRVGDLVFNALLNPDLTIAPDPAVGGAAPKQGETP